MKLAKSEQNSKDMPRVNISNMRTSLRAATIHFYVFLFIPSMSYAQNLQDYFQIAQEQNPELQARKFEFEAAMQRIPQLSSLPDPSASLGVFVSAVETRVGAQRARLSLTQMFPWFGTLEAKRDAAAAQAQVKFYDWLDAQNKLYFDIQKLYYELYELEERIAVLKDNLKYLDSYEALAEAKVSSGAGALADVVRVQLQRNELITNIKLLEDKRRPLQISFNKLLNRDDVETITLPDTLLLPVVDFLQDSLNANPRLTRLDAQHQALALQQQVIAKDRMPKIGAGLDYVVVQKRTDMDLPENGRDVLMPMVTVSLPIWRKKYDAMEQEVAMMQQATDASKENVRNQLASEWAQAQYDLSNAGQRIALFSKQVETTQTILDLLTTAYANSGKAFEEVLRTEQSLVQYRLLTEEARLSYLLAFAKMEYLIASHLK